MTAPTEAEIAREARRVFRKLDAPGAHLAPGEAGQYRIVCRGEGGKQRSGELAAALADAFVRRGWIVRDGKTQRFVLSDAGRGWFARACAGDAPFAAQHQILTRKLVVDRRGIERLVTADEAESPIARLKARGLIDGIQFDAGEKLRRDFTLAQLMPRLGIDLTAPVVLGSRGSKPERLLSDTVIAAKQRFARAMRAVGPGLADLLFDVCCHLRGLHDAERSLGWPRRAARVVLSLALDRLAMHYGLLDLASRAPVRAWKMEGEEKG